jgi:hypothetical protein
MSFKRHVYAVQRYVEFTQAKYAPLLKSNVPTHPICCFGNPAQARVITIGVNPSVGEFDDHRWAAEAMSHNALAERCRTYFAAGAPAAPHSFFTPWREALACLDVTYEAGQAVHLDLSPRATRYIRELRDAFEKELFLEMVQRDLWTFFGTLDLCSDARLILIAGSVTGKYYINEFLQRFAPDHGWALAGAFDRRQHTGPGTTTRHELQNSNRDLPVFFCSCGPAAANPALLTTRICDNAPALIELLEQ